MKKIILVLAVCFTTSQLIAQKNAKQIPPPPPPAPPVEILAPPSAPPAPQEKINEAKIIMDKPVAPPLPPKPPKALKAGKTSKAAVIFTPPVVVKDSN